MGFKEESVVLVRLTTAIFISCQFNGNGAGVMILLMDRSILWGLGNGMVSTIYHAVFEPQHQPYPAHLSPGE